MMEPSLKWWKEMAGPSAFITEVADRLTEGDIIVRVPDDMPWRHDMRMEIQSELRDLEHDPEIIIEQIDAETDVPKDTEIGDYLLNRFALKGEAGQYRKKNGTIPQFIVKRNIFSKQVVWVKGLSNDRLSGWLKFFSEYKELKSKSGRVVLEIRDDLDCPNQEPEAIINYSSFISDYNLQLFNSILLEANQKYSADWKRYVASLAAHLCINDAEISEYFINEDDHQVTEPQVILKRISEDPVYSRRGAGQGSSHILGLIRNGNDLEIQKRIWEAQIQVLFPIIEAKRVEIITRIENELKVLLRAREIIQFKEIVENPYDVEWSTLSKVMNYRGLDDDYYLKSLTRKDKEIIKEFQDYRNTLAHYNCCTVSQIKEILKYSTV